MKHNLTSLAILLFALINISYAQWEPDFRLTNASGNSYTSPNSARCIAANGNFVHAVWRDDRDGNKEIYYKRSIDGGITWEPDIRFTNNIAESESPTISVSGSNVYVVWDDKMDGNYEIYYKLSTDNGLNWGANIRLTNNNAASWCPSIACSGSSVHVVWADGRHSGFEIFYKNSSDGGITWSPDKRLTNSSTSGLPSIAVAGSNVHLVWQDGRNVNLEVYYKLSTDNGLNWGAEIRLTGHSSISDQPSIAVFGSLVHVVWHDDREANPEIYYKRSTDGGINWGADTRFTNNPYYSFSPNIAVSGSLVHVVWFDGRDGNSEIYYKHSTNGGIIWGSETRLTNNPSDSRDPFIAYFGSLLHVLWLDTRDGNYEIYYKRNPTGNVGIQNISTEIPTAFSLEQNNPNPFNPSTKIRFAVAKFAFIKLKFINTLGKEIATPVNESLSPGTYETTFDASNLSSGIYFYTLESDNLKITKKCILLK